MLHSWAGSADMTKQLARIEGVHFSISGHSLSLSDKKLAPMLQQVSYTTALHSSSSNRFLAYRGAQNLSGRLCL